jgi:hypothetical protein
MNDTTDEDLLENLFISSLRHHVALISQWQPGFDEDWALARAREAVNSSHDQPT